MIEPGVTVRTPRGAEVKALSEGRCPAPKSISLSCFFVGLGCHYRIKDPTGSGDPKAEQRQ